MSKDEKKYREHLEELVEEQTIELRESKERFRSLYENVTVGMYRTTPKGQIVMANPALISLLGYDSFEELKKRNLEESGFEPEYPREKFKEEIKKNGKVQGLESKWKRRDGTSVFIRESAKAVKDEKGNIIYYDGTVEDITERKHAENRVKHLNLVLHAIRNVNQLITREKDRDKLLKGTCDLLVKTRGYHNIWIALLDDSEKLITTAESGLGKKFIPMLKQLKKGRLPTCGMKALKQPDIVVTMDPSSACPDCPLSGMYGGRGAVTVRLEFKDKTYGIISVSVPANLTADKEEHALFKEAASDIAFAIHDIELEQKHKRAVEALRESEEKYRILTETVPDIIFTLDRKGRYTYINPAGENVTGYSSQEFLGHDFTEVIAPEYIDTTKDRFERGLSGEKISLYEVEIMHKDGRKIPVELNMTSLFDEDGNIIGRLGVARNITEPKWIQKVLRESEERYRTIFENTGTAMIMIEEDKTVSLANREAEKLSGYSKEEIEGKKKWTEFIVEEDLEKMKGYHEQRRVDPTSAPKKYKFRLIDKKGSIRDILLSIDVIPGTKMSVASLLDVTERKKAEEKIKASLEEKEVMLREIHHRVKNNMQIVISLLRLQSAKAEDKKTQEIFRECQNRIRAMALIHDKLYQSKDLAKINFAQYIDGLAVHVFQSYGVDSNLVAVKTDLEEVFFDLNRAIPCGLIVQELLSNSIKHAFPQGKKGEIWVKLHSDKKGTITLVVSDNGIGFPKDIDFRKASSLGLQMVNDLTKQINGTIKLDRTGGTAFKVKFSVNK